MASAFSESLMASRVCVCGGGIDNIVHIDVRNKPWKCQINISRIGYFTNNQ